MTIINSNNLIRFATKNAADYIGTFNHVPTTLKQEVSWLYGEISRIDVDACRTDWEYDRCLKKYKAAYKKVLWLNTIAREKCGSGFITRRVTDTELVSVVDEFVDVLREHTASKVHDSYTEH